MADEQRTPEPTESWALGTLTGILKEAGIKIEYPIDVNTRSIDVEGLVPPVAVGTKGLSLPPTIRITIEEVT